MVCLNLSRDLHTSNQLLKASSLDELHLLKNTGSWDNVFELSVVLYLVGTLVWNVFSTGEKILDWKVYIVCLQFAVTFISDRQLNPWTQYTSRQQMSHRVDQLLDERQHDIGTSNFNTCNASTTSINLHIPDINYLGCATWLCCCPGKETRWTDEAWISWAMHPFRTCDCILCWA